jgi:hypothetical protein
MVGNGKGLKLKITGTNHCKKKKNYFLFLTSSTTSCGPPEKYPLSQANRFPESVYPCPPGRDPGERPGPKKVN